MVRCCECGRVFDNDEVRTISDNVGEFWGAPAYMDIEVCPYCRSDELEEFDEETDEGGESDE